MLFWTNVSVTYVADDQPTLESAWVDFNKVVVGGKIYTVRSFNGFVADMTTGVIPTGSTFRFSGIDPAGGDTFEDIEGLDVLFLLATPPFTPVDKIQDYFIDLTSVTEEQNPFGFFYSGGAFFADPALLQPIYPIIRPI